nr:GNAT family N-acetyltransferase [uncultured Acetatifactor sp.]
MKTYSIINIQDRPDLRQEAADWFHGKWNVPRQAYLESIDDCLKGQKAVPQWYLAAVEEKNRVQIIAGIGVIENDFHDRRDLAPNVCALYVEEKWRRQGIAGKMLDHVCRDMNKKGISTLYLITDHTSFYERYGWEFFCTAECEGEDPPARLYIHRTI